VHHGSLDLVCTQEQILKVFRITGLTKVFGIHETVDPGHRGQGPVRNVPPEAK
jgi:anti-anti-sigma regulatory factor